MKNISTINFLRYLICFVIISCSVASSGCGDTIIALVAEAVPRSYDVKIVEKNANLASNDKIAIMIEPISSFTSADKYELFNKFLPEALKKANVTNYKLYKEAEKTFSELKSEKFDKIITVNVERIYCTADNVPDSMLAICFGTILVTAQLPDNSGTIIQKLIGDTKGKEAVCDLRELLATLIAKTIIKMYS